MTEPFLNLGNVGFMRQRVCGRRGPHRMDAQAVDLDIQARFQPVLSHYVPINRIRIERTLKLSRAVIPHRAEQRPVSICAVTGQYQVIVDQPLCERMQRDVRKRGMLYPEQVSIARQQ